VGSVDLPAENVDFLAQYEQLDVLAGRTTPSQDDQRQQAPEHGVDNRQQHQSSSQDGEAGILGTYRAQTLHQTRSASPHHTHPHPNR